jgi:hypothetical protein
VCLACNDEGKVTCLEKERYTWCKDRCLRIERLGCDIVCKEGVVRRVRMFCVLR